MSVELRAVDASEAHPAPNRDAATAAHAGAVDHDGVEAGEGAHTPGARDVGGGAHHGNRADDVDGAGRRGLLRLPGVHQVNHGAGEPGRAVVSGPQHLLGGGTQFSVENDLGGRARATQRRNEVAGAAEGAGHRQHFRHTHATRHAKDVANVLDSTGLA